MNDRAATRYLTVLSEYVCNAELRDLPPEIIDRGRWLIADCLPLIAAGMQVKEMRELAKRQLAAEPKGEASVIGYGTRTAPNVAALLNGTAGTWLEMVEENIYAKGMPSIQIVPAAIAIAEQYRASGRDLLLALILGYEASGRIAYATKTKLAIHPSGTHGAIGAAVAAGVLARLGVDAMRELINISATLGLATSRQAIIEGATVGRVYSGASGYMGILALDMVQSGLTGEVDGVRSVYGSVYADPPDVVSRIPQFSKVSFDPDMVIAGLGSDFLMTKSFIKIHACARSIHPALDLIEEVMAKSPGGRIDPREVERIDFHAYFSPTSLAHKNPKTPFGSKFSLPFAVASLIYHGRGQLANFDDQAFANPVIHDLAQRVNISENAQYTAVFPEKQPCDVKVALKNGRVLEAHAQYTKGDPHNPRTVAELTAKFFDVAQRVWNDEHAGKILEGVMAIESIDDMHAFFTRHPI
jgi:2-methylcitrate dehydratase PrpD